MFFLEMMQLLKPHIHSEVRVADPRKYPDDAEYAWYHEEIPEDVWEEGILVEISWESHLEDEVTVWYGEEEHQEELTLTPAGLRMIIADHSFLTITLVDPYRKVGQDSNEGEWILQVRLA